MVVNNGPNGCRESAFTAEGFMAVSIELAPKVFDEVSVRIGTPETKKPYSSRWLR